MVYNQHKWKIAFWICLVILLIISAYSIKTSTDEAFDTVTKSLVQAKVVNDLNYVSKIISETDLTKSSIKDALAEHQLYMYMDFTSDTIQLSQYYLIFSKDRLSKLQAK